MEFHQQHCAESMRDKIINVLLENSAFKEDLSFDHIKNMIPWDTINADEIDSDSSDDDNEPIVKEESLFSDSISDENVAENVAENVDDNVSATNITEEPVTETTKKDKKKKKKEKKEDTSSNTDDKPKRAKPSFVYFKSHPDVQGDIEEASIQLQGDDDKKPGEPVGKVKGAGIVWGNLSAEEKDVWKQRSLEEFKQTLNQ